MYFRVYQFAVLARKGNKTPNNNSSRQNPGENSSNEELKKLLKDQREFLSIELKNIEAKVEALAENEQGLFLTNDEIIGRRKEYGRKNLEILYGFIKVISLTTATIILLNLLIDVRPFNFTSIIQHKVWQSIQEWWCLEKPELIEKHLSYVIKILLWLTTCFALILTYDACMFGSMFIAKPLSKWMIIIVFSFIGFEFLLFSVLFPNFFLEKVFEPKVVESIKTMDFVSWWLLLYGFYTWGICYFCYLIKKMLSKTNYSTDELRVALIRHYNIDSIITFFVGLLSIVLSIYNANIRSNYDEHFRMKEWSDCIAMDKWGIFFALISLSIIVWGFFMQYKRRKEIEIIFLPRDQVD